MNKTNTLRTALLISIMALPSAVFGQDGGGQDYKVDLNINGCQFSGGSDDYGNVTVQKNTGNKKIQVEVMYADDYTIEPVEFSGVGSDQMRSTGGGNGNVVNIFNANTGAADVYYGINLKHKQTGEIIRCDPRIVNQ